MSVTLDLWGTGVLCELPILAFLASYSFICSVTAILFLFVWKHKLGVGGENDSYH